MSNDDQRLAPLRAKIDAIDAELLTLLSKRAKAAQEVGHIKNESSTPIFRPERENQVIQNVLSKNSGPLLPDGIASIWREIMSACRALESRQTIAYLGPVGTFSELAAQQFFGQSIQGLPCAVVMQIAIFPHNLDVPGMEWLVLAHPVLQTLGSNNPHDIA